MSRGYSCYGYGYGWCSFFVLFVCILLFCRVLWSRDGENNKPWPGDTRTLGGGHTRPGIIKEIRLFSQLYHQEKPHGNLETDCFG